MTDAEFVLKVLSDGQPHCLNEILRRSFAERGVGLTVHSRVSDLRQQGHIVSHWQNGERGNGSWYRLALEEATEHFPTVASPSAPAGHDSAVNTPHVAEPASDAGALPSRYDQLVMTGREFRKAAP